MQHVNIYVESTLRGPRHTSGVYEFIMEVHMQPGQDPVTLTKHTELEDSTENTSYVQAAAEAVNRLKSKCEVTFYTPSKFFNMALNEYLPRWKNNGYLSARGDLIANAAEWQAIAQKTAAVRAEDRHHTYQQCMRDDIRRLHLKINEKHHAE